MYEIECKTTIQVDRKYAKELLNTIGAAQAITDADRANISLSYHCVSFTDVYWVRKQGEDVTFARINLYGHSLNEAIVEVSLRGKSLTVTNREFRRDDFAADLSTKGHFPKAWVRCGNGFQLLKDGGSDVVQRELLASKICQCFDIPQVVYTKDVYKEEPVTRSSIVTSKKYSIISKMAFDIYAVNHDLDTIQEAISIDPITYYGMNILDYLVGNTDRHPENWGFLIDNSINRPVSLYPLMDFNQAFFAYDTIDGARCLTTAEKISQREAAILAVRKIGLRQVMEVDLECFVDRVREKDMFIRRLRELRK